MHRFQAKRNYVKTCAALHSTNEECQKRKLNYYLCFCRLSVFEMCRGTDFLLDRCKYFQLELRQGLRRRYRNKNISGCSKGITSSRYLCLAIVVWSVFDGDRYWVGCTAGRHLRLCPQGIPCSVMTESYELPSNIVMFCRQVWHVDWTFTFNIYI